jgi:uncharacterized protein YrrD
MMRIREALGRRVVARDTAEEIGQVRQVIIGRDARITAITTGPFKLGPDGPGWLDWSSIVGFGPDAVVAATALSVRRLASDEELAAISGGGLLDRPLMTDAGDIVGSIADVEFDTATGRLTAFLVGERAVPLTRLVAIGPFAVIVAAPKGTPQDPGS